MTDLDKDMYNEQMFERKANGLPVISFEQWSYQQETMKKLWEALDNERKAN